MTSNEPVYIAWAHCKESISGTFHALQIGGPKGSSESEWMGHCAAVAVCGFDLGYRWTTVQHDKLWTAYRKNKPETFLLAFCCGRCATVLRSRIQKHLDLQWREYA